MVADVQEKYMRLRFVEKSEENSIAAVDRKTPLAAQSSVEFMRIESGIERILPKDQFCALRFFLHFRR